MKRVILVHGWGGNPENNWFPWLKKKLEDDGFKVIVPKMPDTEHPRINKWVGKLREVDGKVDENTYFVGHSIGCQTIMRYLDKENKKVGGVIFVAGFFNLPNLETKEEKKIAKPWLNTPINTNKIRFLSKYVSIFSDDDPDVPLSDKNLFKDRLNAEIIIEHKKGHFNDDANIKKLPIVYNKIMKMS